MKEARGLDSFPPPPPCATKIFSATGPALLRAGLERSEAMAPPESNVRKVRDVKNKINGSG